MPYTYISILYSSKPLGEPNEYYITTTDDLVKYLSQVGLIKSVCKTITYHVINSTPPSN